MLLWRSPSRATRRATSLDIVGTVLVTAGLFALVFGLIQTNTHSWLSAEILGLFVAAAVLLVSFVVWEMRTP